MTTQENTVLLTEISMKLDKIIQLLEAKKVIELDMEFTKANNVENTFIEDRQKEIFQELDRK